MVLIFTTTMVEQGVLYSVIVDFTITPREHYGQPWLTIVTFVGNTASGNNVSYRTLSEEYLTGNFDGGALNLLSNSRVIDCTFTNNSAHYGGAISLNSVSFDATRNVVIRGCVFT